MNAKARSLLLRDNEVIQQGLRPEAEVEEVGQRTFNDPLDSCQQNRHADAVEVKIVGRAGAILWRMSHLEPP